MSTPCLYTTHEYKTLHMQSSYTQLLVLQLHIVCTWNGSGISKTHGARRVLVLLAQLQYITRICEFADYSDYAFLLVITNDRTNGSHTSSSRHDIAMTTPHTASTHTCITRVSCSTGAVCDNNTLWLMRPIVFECHCIVIDIVTDSTSSRCASMLTAWCHCVVMMMDAPRAWCNTATVILHHAGTCRTLSLDQLSLPAFVNARAVIARRRRWW